MIKHLLSHPNTPIFLIWSCLLLLPFGRTAEIPGGIMAIVAAVMLYRREISISRQGYRLFTLTFIAIWIPMLLSVVDADVATKAAKSTLGYLRFYLAGLFIIWVLQHRAQRNLLIKLISLLLLFWIGDALLQLWLGKDLFGHGLIASRLNGIFGTTLMLGIMTAILSPFLFSWCKEHFHIAFLPAIGLALFIVIAAGSRASLVLFSLIMTAYFISHLQSHKKAAIPLIMVALIAVGAISILSYQYSPSIANRVDRTLLLFSGERKQIDLALSFRLPIWEGAAAMITAHPINGVGVRNFRYAYPEVALPDDLFLTQHKVSPHHPHQLILELFSETGIFGLLGLITLYYLLIQAWIKSTSAQKKLAIPAAVALLAALFPINTHLAIFSSFWGQIIWWLIALYIALINIPSEPADTD